VVKADLHTFADKKRVRAAILEAEKATDASIAVSIAPHVDGDVHAAALRALDARKHGPAAVLFFVLPSRREFAVVGNARAHEALGQETWDAIVTVVERYFRDGDPTAGLVAGVEEAGRYLARVFPRGGAPTR
jgi:uncharacterized membrane protein